MPYTLPRPNRPHACRIDAMDLHVAARLKRRRLRLRLEPQLLDVAIGEQSGTIERVERGDKRLGASQLYKLAVVLGVGVPYFFASDLDGLDGEDRKVADLPATDHKALLEAKRFARAYSRISSLEIKHMIRDLLKSLVTDKEIPAIALPDNDAPPDDVAPGDAADDDAAPGERAPREAVSDEPAPDSPAPEHWLPTDMPRAEHKRAP